MLGTLLMVCITIEYCLTHFLCLRFVWGSVFEGVCVRMCVCLSCLQVFLRCGLYHGGDALCAASTTRPETAHQVCCHWNENLEFERKVCDIPRSAKLCYVLYSSRDSQAKKKKKAAQKEVCRNTYK